MKHTLLITAVLTLATLSSATSYGQVTIGSKKVPVSGALLDLKDNDASTVVGGTTSKRGLGLPIVKLTDKDNLYPMFEQIAGNNIPNEDYDNQTKKDKEDERHIGLIVYNPDKCSLEGDGLYVWEETGWTKLETNKTTVGLNLSTANLRIWNGFSGSVEVSWNPSTLSPPTLSSADMTFTVNPDPLVGSPVMALVRPTEMTVSELSTNPFMKKKGTLTYTLLGSPCVPAGAPQSKSINVEQISKALLVDGKANPTPIAIDTDNTTYHLTVQSNARWMMSIATGAAVASSQVNTPMGKDDNSGDKSLAETISVTLKGRTGSTRRRTNYVIFSDQHAPKRFKDVVLTVYQCEGETDYSMEEYKDMWEDMYGMFAGNEPDSNGNEDLNKRQVQWHYDQDKKTIHGENCGNIFFSAMFGDKRWMTTNLAAKVYDTNIGKRPFPIENDMIYSWTDLGPCRWAYFHSFDPKDPEIYKRIPRHGLLYSWVMFSAFGEKTKQGICPNGWRLPTVNEVKSLANEVINNYLEYTNATSKPATGTAVGLMNPCPHWSQVGYYNALGCSKDFLNGGFDLLLSAGFFSGQPVEGFCKIPTSEYTINNAGTEVRCKGFEIVYKASPLFQNDIREGDQVSVRCVKND